MNNSSQYTFPIFISSTDYDLKDIRAETARYLIELGYKPFLSSSNGFPDYSPELEPWESCLKVLDQSFVMVIIIDGRYGKKLFWPNYKNIFKRNKYSPTHGEYIYAHYHKKRMWVFIRKEIMTYYSIYRKEKKRTNDPKKLKSKLKSLPDFIDFEVFEFINEVKTTKPIPWINVFDDITSIKQGFQMKMINALAEVFMIQNKHLETVINAFDNVMDSIGPDKRKEILKNLNSTRELTKAKEELVHKKEELEITKKEIKSTKRARKSDNKDKENKIKILNEKISQMKDQIKDYKNSQNKFIFKDGKMQIQPSSSDLNPSIYSGSTNLANFEDSIILSTDKTCNKCGKKEVKDSSCPVSFSAGDSFRFCPSCGRNYCEKCWPITPGINCPDCSF